MSHEDTGRLPSQPSFTLPKPLADIASALAMGTLHRTDSPGYPGLLHFEAPSESPRRLLPTESYDARWRPRFVLRKPISMYLMDCPFRHFGDTGLAVDEARVGLKGGMFPPGSRLSMLKDDPDISHQ